VVGNFGEESQTPGSVTNLEAPNLGTGTRRTIKLDIEKRQKDGIGEEEKRDAKGGRNVPSTETVASIQAVCQM
jgi:hypothetical protein